MVQQSGSELELTQIATARSTAGDWKESAKPLMIQLVDQLVEQGLTPSMRRDLLNEVEEQVTCSYSLVITL